MQTISFLLFRLLAFVVKNHLKREKKLKKNSFFPFTPTPSPGYPQDPDPHENFCPDPDPDPQKKMRIRNPGFFSKILKYSGLWSFSAFPLCQCIPTRQVEHQRCSRTGRVQKHHKILRKKHNI